MLRPLFLLVAAAGLATSAPMTYTLTGTGTGYWNSQPFTDATFTFTFTSDTTTIVHGTSCCGNTDSTPSGTVATVTVTGFPPAQLAGDQAIFIDHAGETAGIWHFNSAQFATVTNAVFSTDDLTTTIPPNTVTGTAWSYATPFTLGTGGTLYFTSVQNVYYSQQPGSSGGQLSTVSVTPSSGTQMEFTTQTYTFVVGDTSGASDIGGVDIQFRDKPAQPNACWLYYNATNNTLAVNHQNNWGAATPIGSGGSALTGDGCAVDTTAVTVRTSGNNFTLAIPMQPTFADSNIWQIFVDAQSKENVDAGYSQLGTVTVQGSQESGTFSLFTSPANTVVYARPGDTATFTVTMTDQNGFNEPVTFSATSTAETGASGNTTQLGFSFNPPTLTTSGSTTMTVMTPPNATPDGYILTVTGTSQTVTQTTNGYTDAFVQIQNGPPSVVLSPTTGSGTSQRFTLNFSGSPTAVGNFPDSINLLIAPSLDGRNACWIYYNNDANGNDPGAGQIYLASDDGTSWTSAGSAQAGFGTASNSQCTIGPGFSVAPLTIPVKFNSGFAGTKTIYVEAVNGAGFDTGYQPLGGWTAQ